MEELLNKLIKMGWKPFGKEAKEIYIDKNEITIERLNGFRVVYTTRQISSIDSGLWQFCCENGLIPEDKMKHERLLDLTFGPYGPEVKAQMHSRTYEYRLIESALCNEENLEKFLLDNIKIS